MNQTKLESEIRTLTEKITELAGKNSETAGLVQTICDMYQWMQWTPQQIDAIQTNGKSIIVSAAAGSGKTTVLVERLLRILSGGEVRMDEIIVVTFTKDAAANMKSKLNRRISHRLKTLAAELELIGCVMEQKFSALEAAVYQLLLLLPKKEFDNGEAVSGSTCLQQLEEEKNKTYQWLFRQRNMLGSARISTIHSFCFDFIRENAESYGISPKFSITDKAHEDIIRKKVMERKLREWSMKYDEEKNPGGRREEMQFLFNYFSVQDSSEIGYRILKLDGYLGAMAFPEYWMHQAEELCRNQTQFLERIRKDICQELEECIGLAQLCSGFAHDAYDDPNDRKYEKILNNDLAKLGALRQFYQKSTADEIIAEHRTIGKFMNMPGGKKNEDYYHEEEKENFDKIRRIYKGKYSCMETALIQPLAFWKEDVLLQEKLIPLLLELTREFQAALREEKKNENILSFDDAERFVLEKLGEINLQTGAVTKTPLAEDFSSRYKLIMIDEYQDSNDKQDCLFKLLSDADAQGRQKLLYGKNAFLVGDIKQSIYRFRQANPDNFLNTLSKDPYPEEILSRIDLNQNFRSAPGILNFINALFRAVMSEKCGEIEYNAQHQLNPGTKAYENLNPQYQGVSILFPAAVKEKEKNPPDLQAACMADTIAEMLREQFPVPQKKKENASAPDTRPCEYKDFCILVRTLHIKAICAELEQRGIPFSCDDSDGFLMLPEIQLISNLLRVTDNPLADVPMAGVLLSPVYGFTPEDLAMLKVSGNGRRIYLQMKSLGEYDNSVLAQKCRLFLNQLEEMRSMADTMPLEQLIYEIYEMTDLLSLQSLYDQAEERRDRLELFAQQAKEYQDHADLAGQSCLSGWIRRLDSLLESSETFQVNPEGSQGNYVSVKTIHKSKGLEYPFVFLLYSQRKFSSKPAPPPLLADETGLLGLQMLDRKNYLKFNSAAYQYLNYQRDKKEKSEEMRLLYVALTRAQQKLFLVMDEVLTGDIPQSHICNTAGFLEIYPDAAKLLAPDLNSMQDWILAYLLSSDECDALNSAMNGRSYHSAMAEYWVWHPGTGAEAAAANTEISAEQDSSLVQRMQRQLAWRYAADQTELPAKRTVTSLSHPEEDAPETSEIPDFMLEDEQGRAQKLWGAAKGTAIHKIMQFIDFQAAAEQLSQELERMQKAKILDSAEAQAMKQEKIKAFFTSDLYQRIAAASQILKEKQLFIRIGDLNLPETSVLRQNYKNSDGIMIGTVDLLFREASGWVIVDYKTDRVQNAAQLTEKYALQLGLYQKAMEQILEEPVKQMYLYSFTLDQAIEILPEQILYP